VVKLWCPGDGSSVLENVNSDYYNGFVQEFVYGRLVVDCMTILADAKFNVKDAMQMRVLNEIACLIYALKLCRSEEEFRANFVVKFELGYCGVNLNALMTCENEKAATKIFKQWVVCYRDLEIQKQQQRLFELQQNQQQVLYEEAQRMAGT